LDAEFIAGLVRASVPGAYVRIASVLEIFDPHLARPEARGRQVAKAVEEGHAV
jgi:hypothetical protein